MIKSIVNNFCMVFTLNMAGVMVYTFIGIGPDINFRTVVAMFVLALLIAPLEIVAHYKDNASTKEIVLRYVAHMLGVMTIGLLASTYMGWIVWHIPITALRVVLLMAIVYAIVLGANVYWDRKLANALNEKLKERYPE